MTCIELPRRLVTQLLQQIQRGHAGRAQDGLHAEPGLPPLVWRLHDDAETPPAVDNLPEPPGVYLAVTLTTKGVLQIHAWQLRDGRAEPVAVEIIEA